MATGIVEDRVALLERKLLPLKQQLLGTAIMSWWEQISGVFADVLAFDEGAELGSQPRKSQRPATEGDAGVTAHLSQELL